MIYLLIIILIALLIYNKRKDIKNYLDKEMSNIKDLNDIDEETQGLIRYYSTFSTEDLINQQNHRDLNEKEKRAIKNVLDDRQLPPPSVF